MLEIKDLSLSFGEKTVFDKTEISIPIGEITGIVGRNGAGKTTFFNILSGIQEAESLRLLFPNNWTKANIGFLQTDNYHYPRMNGKEYLELCSFASKNGQPELDELNQLFQLPLQQAIESYSSGMKKKLFLLGLLLQKKEILILDEPYNGLDLESSILLNKILQTLRENGKTILISSHILGSLTNLCDSIYLLQNGKFEQFHQTDFTKLENKLDQEIYTSNMAEVLKNY
jgi:ABC-2 type transport system ATP-binding protein